KVPDTPSLHDALPVSLRVRDDKAGWYELGDYAELAFGPGQVVLMRKDPPFDGEYLYDTHILDIARAAGAEVVNNPQGLRDFNEKDRKSTRLNSSHVKI